MHNKTVNLSGRQQNQSGACRQFLIWLTGYWPSMVWMNGGSVLIMRGGGPVCAISPPRPSLFHGIMRAKASVDHITDTILHEIAHALVGPRHGHNAIWRQKAREIGCTAMRCHNLTFSAAKWMMMCPNGCFAVPAPPPQIRAGLREMQTACPFCSSRRL